MLCIDILELTVCLSGKRDNHVLHKAFQGKEIIMFYINELKTEGVDTAPRWTQPDNVESESGLFLLLLR